MNSDLGTRKTTQPQTSGGPADEPAQTAALPAYVPLVAYVLIAFGISWLMWLPGVLTYFGYLDLAPQLIGYMGVAGLLGPIVAGGLVTAVVDGRTGVRRWLSSIVRWRVGVQWYLFALVGLPLAVFLVSLLWPGAAASLDLSAQPVSVAYLSAFVFMTLLGGPGVEEPGWTGFAQPRIQRQFGPLAGGLLLGVLWALWHLPGFLIPSQGLGDIPPRGTVGEFVIFTLALIGLRLIIIWAANNTGGSVLIAILVHASWNTFYSAALIRLLPAPSVVGTYLNLAIAVNILALVVVIATRGHLGYQGDDPAAHDATSAAAGSRTITS